jgi:hypothetical protein
VRSSLLVAAALVIAYPLHAQVQVDTAGAGALIDQAMNHSEVMANTQHLADAIGPRLTGSAAARKANDWTASKFQGYGLTAALEAWNFGVTWERGPIQVRLLEPFPRQITGHSWAWTAGTNGKTLVGTVMRVNFSTPESLAVYQDKVKGKWILPGAPFPVWNTDGIPMTAEDSAAQAAERQRRFQPPADTSQAAMEKRRQFALDALYMLKKAGALGTLTDGAKEHALMNMSGSPNRVSTLPNIVISHEDYAMLDRQLQAGMTPKVEARVDNQFGKSAVTQWNTVAEIKGSELPGQVVILGAHLDSWDLGTGVTDNGTGSMVVLEAARVIAQSGLKPRRTIRFILFTGEEEGLLGSNSYAAAHAADMDSIQAVLVLDNGTGAITGQALQGRNDDRALWEALLAPVASMGAKDVREGNKGGTDHLSFIPYGVPAWNFDQISRGYNHTHHSQSDTYEHAVGPDLMQASAVMAVTAYELANLDQLLPRGPKKPATPPVVLKPSPGLAGN